MLQAIPTPRRPISKPAHCQFIIGQILASIPSILLIITGAFSLASSCYSNNITISICCCTPFSILPIFVLSLINIIIFSVSSTLQLFKSRMRSENLFNSQNKKKCISKNEFKTVITHTFLSMTCFALFLIKFENCIDDLGAQLILCSTFLTLFISFILLFFIQKERKKFTIKTQLPRFLLPERMV